MTRPFSSSIPCTSQPLTYATPVCSKKGWRRSKRVPYTRLGLTVIRKQTSCFRSPAGKGGQVNEKSRHGNRTFHSQTTTGKFRLNVAWYKMFTFPLMLDVIFDIEVNSDISSYAGRPALPDVGFCDLHNGKGGDVLSHPGPAPEHHTAILWLPVQGDRRELYKCCWLLSSLKSAGFRAAHSTTAYFFWNNKQVWTPVDIMGTLIVSKYGVVKCHKL